LHFHWGPDNQQGSEHVFEGTTSTFEVHFVHYSSDYDGVASAVAAWNELSEDDAQDMHTLGVVGFLFEEVDDDESYNGLADAVLLQFAEDPAMDEVWQNATGSAELSFAITELVAADSFMQNWIHYWGSLTTPPCTPAVSWHLARETIKVRGSTMDAFRVRTKQWTTASGAVDADINFRPVQSNPSCIASCDEEFCPETFEDLDDDDSSNDGDMSPLWVTLGSLAIIVLIVSVMYWARDRRSLSKAHPPSHGNPRMEKVSTVEDNGQVGTPVGTEMETLAGGNRTNDADDAWQE